VPFNLFPWARAERPLAYARCDRGTAVGHPPPDRPPAVRVRATTTLSEAAQVMLEENVSSLVVDPRGERFLTERDLSRALAGGFGPDDPVDVVSTDSVRVPAGTSVVDAAAIMLNNHVRHLVIDGWEDGVAVVSLRAVMAVLLQAVTPELWLEPLRLAIGPGTEVWLG
jgi:signal-transduction protein with cAMP-binding, CBS, and nucleotidyltransferase domain